MKSNMYLKFFISGSLLVGGIPYLFLSNNTHRSKSKTKNIELNEIKNKEVKVKENKISSLNLIEEKIIPIKKSQLIKKNIKKKNQIDKEQLILKPSPKKTIEVVDLRIQPDSDYFGFEGDIIKGCDLNDPAKRKKCQAEWNRGRVPCPVTQRCKNDRLNLGLKMNQVDTILNTKRNEILACFERCVSTQCKRAKKIKKNIVTHWEINDKGLTQNIGIKGSKLEKPVYACVRQEIQNMNFPAFGEDLMVKVQIPWSIIAFEPLANL